MATATNVYQLGQNCISKFYHFSIKIQTVLELRYARETALMLAAQGGHTETVKTLIEAGADVSSKKTVR